MLYKLIIIQNQIIMLRALEIVIVTLTVLALCLSTQAPLKCLPDNFQDMYTWVREELVILMINF